MTEQQLDGAHIGARFERVRREGARAPSLPLYFKSDTACKLMRKALRERIVILIRMRSFRQELE